MKLSQILKHLEENKDNIEFLPTGFSKLDEFLDGGFMRKELIVIGANSGTGKSYVAGQMFYNIAEKGFKCGYYSLELANEIVVSRLIGGLSNIKPTRVISGLLKQDEFESLTMARVEIAKFEDVMNFEDDMYELELIIKDITKNGFDFVVIDFIQNVFTKGKDEYERLSRISLELQKFAKKANCTILILSQLSNQAAKLGSKATNIEYKGSGSIVNVCDLGFIVERSDLESNEHTVMLNLRKNRRGTPNVAFNLKFTYPGGKIHE